MTAYVFGLDTNQILSLADAPEGTTVEVIDGPAHNYVRSGRVYTIGRVCNHLTGQRYAWKRFTNERVTLHPTLQVITADEYRDEHGRWA